MYNACIKAFEKSSFDVVREECHGSRTDHSSQKQHDVCLFITYEQQVGRFIDDDLKRSDDVEIIEDWIKEVES